jgi:hypothetical protein
LQRDRFADLVKAWSAASPEERLRFMGEVRKAKAHSPP